VRESRDKIEIQLDARRLVTHRRIAEAEHERVLPPEHRPPRGQKGSRPDPHPEENAIVTAVPELAEYVAGLKQRSRKMIMYLLPKDTCKSLLAYMSRSLLATQRDHRVHAQRAPH
jgi:hypothetical protein